MTDSGLLAVTLIHANRWVGVTIALIGSVVVAPSGTALLWRTATQWITRRTRQMWVQVGRVVPFLHRQPHNVSLSAEGTTSVTGTVTATVTAAPWDPAAPLQDQISLLHRHIELAEARLDFVSDQQGQEIRARERQVAELERTLREDITVLHRLVEEKDQEGARIDARGLPVIGFGIVLSGIPDELAAIPFGLGWIFPLAGLSWGIAAVAGALMPWRSRRAST